MANLRWVIDNNILVSRLLSPSSIPAQAVRLALEIGELLVSEEVLDELTRVLKKSKFDPYISLENRESFVERLRLISNLISVKTNIEVCRDSQDNKFLELAVDGKAKLIITGDQDLLVLNPFKEIQIITPKNFLLMYN